MIRPPSLLRSYGAAAFAQKACRAEAPQERRLEATPGIEPGCKDLQSSA